MYQPSKRRTTKDHYACKRLTCCHITREKNSCATIRSRVEPVTISSRWSKGRRWAQSWIQCAVIWITCMIWKFEDLLKTRLFRQFHIDQQIAETPIRIRALVFLSIPFNQLPNIFLILVGGGILYVLYTTLQTSCANEHERKICSIVSSNQQKEHLVHPFHFLLARLSLVSKTFLLRNHIKIFIFSGNFSFHKNLCK